MPVHKLVNWLTHCVLIVLLFFALVLHSQGLKISICENVCPEWLRWGLIIIIIILFFLNFIIIIRVVVSVSRCTNVTSRLRKIVNVLVSGGRRLGLGHLRLVPKTSFRPNCAGHSTQCERALDVVSLCCSYYCSSY